MQIVPVVLVYPLPKLLEDKLIRMSNFEGLVCARPV